MGAIDGIFSAFSNMLTGLTGQQTQRDINEENLEFQRERNKIEDARYAEETAYNRAFAENERNYQREWALNEREYQRNLQQEIFEREDTAIARQAEALRAQGINPASQNMNGLGAGSVVSASSPASQTSAPTLSGRGGQALNKAMITSQGINGLLTPILQTLNTVDTIKSNGLQRDVLNAQALKAQAEANMAILLMYDTFNRLNINEFSFPFGSKTNKKYYFKMDPETYNPYNFTPQMLNDLDGKTKFNQYKLLGYGNKIKKLEANKLDSFDDAMKYLTSKLMDKSPDFLEGNFTSLIEKLLQKAFK